VVAPAATFGAYASQATLQGSDSLNTVQAFTSLALITLVSYPGTRLLAALPNLASAIGCLDRIRDFLLFESRTEDRVLMNSIAKSQGNGKLSSIDDPILSGGDVEDSAIRLENVSISPAPQAEVLLKDVNLSIAKGSTVMITGPVGSGKSSILRALLGELPCGTGSIYIQSKRMAYCSQSPWLRNGTIREAICGPKYAAYDQAWYRTVLEACALSYDIAHFPAGDQTVIGGRGTTLSGGQGHRVALARALYSRAKIFVLDDIFSALDKKTEKAVTERLFGKEGLFTQLGATVILATHSSKSQTLVLRFCASTNTVTGQLNFFILLTKSSSSPKTEKFYKGLMRN
jgi:ATP-binding cassette subfamily C (CFTR/MRP) protein 1